MLIKALITQKDYLAYRRHVARSMRSGFGLPLTITTVAILAAVIALDGLTGWEPHLETLLLGGIIVAGWLLVLVRVYAAKARFKDDGYVLGERLYRVDERGFHVASRFTDSLTYWSAIENVQETDTHVFLMVEPLVGYIVPKGAFADDEQCRQFVTQVSRYVAISPPPGDAPQTDMLNNARRTDAPNNDDPKETSP